MSFAPVISQGTGYGVVLGLGFGFSLLMIGLTSIQNRYTTTKTQSLEEFTSASGNVKPGLIASGIVSAWTWASTLLTSSALTFKLGISGAWWYGAGATVQIFLFAQNAAKIKMNAPKANTFLQIIQTRWGSFAHFTFLFFALATNVLVSSMLITGGSGTIHALTGVPVIACCFLIPLVVVVYVLVGGMRATLLCDYLHTTLLFAIIITFMSVVYGNSELIGSPRKMWELLNAVSAVHPIEGNAEGSYLTMRSKSGLIFGVINVIGNFATVYLDQAYWQRAIASEPVTCVTAFMIGGSAWLAVPLGFASTLGLAAAAIGVKLTPAEVGAGLPAPAASSILMGYSGAMLMLVLLFMAVTSATSAELVAVSSLATYDIYLPYINPQATQKQLLFVDHVAIGIYGLVMALLGIILFYLGVSLGWIYEFMGCLLGSAVVPVALCIASTRANKWGCIIGAWAGLAAGIIAWLVTTSTLYGEINVDTTFNDYPMLAGNLASIGVGALIAGVSTLIWPDNFDFEITRTQAGVREVIPVEIVDSSAMTEEKGEKVDGTAEELVLSAAASVSSDDPNYDPIQLQKAYNIAVRVSVGLFVVLILLIPLPLFFSSHIYSVADFTTWIVVAFIWVIYGTCAVVLFPVYESRHAISSIARAMIRDCFGGGLRSKDDVIIA